LRRPVAKHGSLRRQRDTAALALASAGLEIEPEADPRWDEYDHLDLVRRYTAEREAPPVTFLPPPVRRFLVTRLGMTDCPCR
jgi:hypothetical protein